MIMIWDCIKFPIRPIRIRLRLFPVFQPTRNVILSTLKGFHSEPNLVFKVFETLPFFLTDFESVFIADRVRKPVIIIILWSDC